MVNEPSRAALNASQYGTGKTLVTVEVAARLGGRVNLIIAPLFTRISWKNTILRQYPDATVHIIGSTKSGRAGLEHLLAGDSGWYIIGRELFASKNIRERILPVSHKIDFAAYDECQAWANRKSIGWVQVMKKFKPGYKMALSATPYGNKFQNFFTLQQWLWPKMEGHQSFWTWVGDHCETEYDPWAGTVIKGEKNPGHFVAMLPCYVRLEKDFGEPIQYTIDVTLSPKERKIYDQFNENLIVFLKNNPLIAKVPAVKRTRLRQMTLGELEIIDDVVTFPENMKSTKYETLVELLTTAEEPAIIFTHSQKYAAVVARRLRADGFAAMEWSGDVSPTQREAIKILFENDQGVDYIVATIGSIGEGVDGLQHRSRLMIWLSRDDNNMLNEQAFRRLYRRGQERQVVSVDIMAEDTYDSGQFNNLVEQTLAMNKSLRSK